MLVRNLLEKHPDSVFHLMTPGGFVDLTPEQVKRLLNGEDMKAHPGTIEYGIEVEAAEILNQEVQTINKKDNAFYILTVCAGNTEEQGEQGGEINPWQ